ncbi:MAG: cysteine hydrolase family protein [Gaiellaceae bacterium]
MREVFGKLVRESLDEVLDPAVCAVVSIDMQNDAMHPDGMLAQAGNDISGMLAILPRCQAFLEEARRLEVLVVHIETITLPEGRSDSPSWLRAKGLIVQSDFFLEGTWGAEFSPEVAPLAGEPVVTKHRSSGFRNTDLDLILRSNGIETVVVIGEQTPGCIEATYRDAAYHDYYNVLIEDCVAAFDHEQHEASLLIQRRRHDVCMAEEALAIWRRHRGASAPAATSVTGTS